MILTLVAVNLLAIFLGSMEFCSDVGGLNEFCNEVVFFCRGLVLWRFVGDVGVWFFGFWMLFFLLILGLEIKPCESRLQGSICPTPPKKKTKYKTKKRKNPQKGRKNTLPTGRLILVYHRGKGP